MWWRKFPNTDTPFDDYPPEGITVKVTDGLTIDDAYGVYSGGFEWIKIDEEDDIVEMTIKPTHWMHEEDYIKYKRDQILDQLI